MKKLTDKKILLILMAGFLIAGIVAAILQSFFKEQDAGLLTRDEANRMVEDALRQAQVDIRQELDEKDNTQTAKTEEKTEESEAEEEPEVEEPEEPEELAVTWPLYKFTVNVGMQNYRMGPTRFDRAINYVSQGTSGYVVRRADEHSFSLVVVNDTVAYMHSHYLDFEEVGQDEYPMEYQNIKDEDAGKKVSELDLSEREINPANAPEGTATASEEGDADTGSDSDTDAENTNTDAQAESTSQSSAGSSQSSAGSTGSSSSDAAADKSVEDASAEEIRNALQNQAESNATQQKSDLDRQLEAGEITEEEMKERYAEQEQQ